MENVEFKDNAGNPTVVSDASDYEIPFRKNSLFFLVYTNYVSFIKGVEKTIRTSDDYTEYVASLKSRGLTRCQVLGNVDSNMSEKGHKVSVEMHHGPIFTLFDYCAAVILSLVKQGKIVTTFQIAKLVMDEHWAGNVQTVMLSSTVHAAVDSGKIFISLKQSTGDLSGFIKKYGTGLTDKNIKDINGYIDLSLKHKSTDNGLFDLQDAMVDWSRRRYN